MVGFVNKEKIIYISSERRMYRKYITMYIFTYMYDIKQLVDFHTVARMINRA